MRTPLPDGCPSCDKAFRYVEDILDKSITPTPGDLSVCSGCAAFLVFKDDLTLRELTLDEFKELHLGNQRDLLRARSLIESASLDKPS